MNFLQVKVLLITCFIVMPGCAGSMLQPMPPDVEITNVELSGISFPETKVMLSLVVSNPNDFDIHVASIDMKVHVMGYLITDENWSNVEALHSHQKRNMRVPVTVDMLNALVLLPKLMSETKVPYMVSGTAKLKNYHKEMTFKYEGYYNTSQMQGMTQDIKNDNTGKKIYWF